MQRLDSEDLKKAGLKATLPRLKILRILENSDTRHLTAEEVYRHLLDAGEEVGLATVYRVLTQFEAAGLVKRHHFEGDRSIFELHEGGHHDHMVCTACGKVIEFFDPAIEERQREIAAHHDFAMSEHSLYLYGTCRGMRERGICSLSTDTESTQPAKPA